MPLPYVSFMVRDYDEAIDWFRRCLGFDLTEDTDLGDKRWVVVEAPGGGKLLLAKPSSTEQAQLIGAQYKDRIGFFLHVEDFDAAAARMRAEDVVFEEDPREEPYGKVAIFRDLYGNRWDLVQPG
ncbi:MAG: VOC family protein [Pseudomonadota bacterium]